MDFSESYRASVLPAYSPDGRYVAAAVEYRLVIREVESLKVVQIYSCLDKINRVEWSANGKYVVCGLYARGIVQVWSVEDPEWTCKIDEGPAGIKHVMWTSDGLSLVLVADFCVRMTVWSLVDRECTYLPGPKFAGKGMAFSPQGDLFAVLERKDSKDRLAIYSSSNWELLSRTQLSSMDAADLAWSPDSSKVAIWDSCLCYKVLIHAADGSSIGSYSAYDDGLGIRGVQWSPGGDLLAVGSYDQVVRVLNNITWQPLLECQHGSPVDEPAEVAVYQEVEEPRGVLAPVQVQQQQQQAKRETRAKYLVCSLPVDITSVTPPTNKPNPKLGISMMAWSPDSQLLATVNENMPHAVWVWDVSAAVLTAVLLHISTVRGLAWAPTGGYLAVTTGNSRVYVWTVEGASIVHIPLSGFNAVQLKWGPDGTNFALMDQEAFCCAYVTS